MTFDSFQPNELRLSQVAMTCTRLTKGPGIARTQLAGVAGGYGCGKTLGLSLPITDRPRSSALFMTCLIYWITYAPSAQTATPAWTATERHSYTPLLILMTWAHHSTPGAGSCFRSSIIANQQLPTVVPPTNPRKWIRASLRGWWMLICKPTTAPDYR